MIRTKKDFKGKTIKIPQNISEKKFDKIEAKLKRLGFDTFFLLYCDIEEYPYMAINDNNFNDIIQWSKEPNEDKSRKQKKIDKYFLSLQEISVKEFLREEKEYFDLNSLTKSIYYDLSKKYPSFPHLLIENIKESKKRIYIKGKIKDYNPHLTIAGVEIAYCPQCSNKARKFKTAEEAIKWMYKNPMKEISYEVNGSKTRGRFNNGVGLLGKQRYFEFRYDNGKDKDWRFDEDCFAKNFNSVNINWLNIRECKETPPTFGLL